MKKGNETVKIGAIKLTSLNDMKKSKTGNYTTKKNTLALATTTKEVRPGCFVIDKPEEKTEAGFCFDCHRGGDNDDSVLFSLLKKKVFKSALLGHLKTIQSKSADKVRSQTVVSGDTIQKICSPEKSLKIIIKNFNKTCPKYKFERFFKTMYCESCKKGIPPEIMMAMMSIESGGRCPAQSKNNLERSAGLFQINANVHQCRDLKGRTYKKKSRANLQCFKDPINNMNKSIDILFDHYKKVNDGAPDISQCKSWLNMTNKERDSWRRGVSAYNGGPGWLTRAIESVRNKETLKNSKYLSGQHKISNSPHKKDDASWEKLRLYYFVEKLSQGVKPTVKCGDEHREKGTGRKISCTISNLAHTEAVLGRSVKSPSPAMVDIWSQYLKKKKVSCKKK